MIRAGFEFLLRGGWIMWPLFACALVSVTVMVERAWVLRRAGQGGEALTEEICRHLAAGRPDAALAEAERARGPIAAVLAAGLRQRGRGPAAVDQAMQAAALKQVPILHRRLGWLDTIVTMAPLLGLLGTITGMIRAFQVVATASGAAAAPHITGGVAEALIATATGLAVAVTTLPVYNNLSERAREIVNAMQASATEVQSLLALPGDPVLSPTNGASALDPVAAARAAAARARGEAAAAHAPATTTA